METDIQQIEWNPNSWVFKMFFVFLQISHPNLSEAFTKSARRVRVVRIDGWLGGWTADKKRRILTIMLTLL